MTTPQLIVATLGAAALIEAVTLVFRFGFGLQSTRDTRWLARWTRGLRIHHGYVGAVALGPFAFAPLPPLVSEIGIVIAGALILSDFAHHFLVLWPLTGSPQFDLTYDANGECGTESAGELKAETESPASGRRPYSQ